MAKVGVCLLQDCKLELAGCLADATCTESLLCLQTCQGREDESDCQVQCGDQFNDDAVQRFNTCAVTEEKCVPQQQDGESIYPLPDEAALVPEFPTDLFVGDWWITAGQNKLFDIFDCQLHTFSAPGPGQISGDIRWRVQDKVQQSLGRKGAFFENEVTQDFVQRPDKPFLLENHDNEYLHYTDDWYIVDYDISGNDDTDFVLIYYRGSNDAWDGYGGAVVYTRARAFPEAIRARVTEGCKRVGYDFETDLFITDNTCKPQPPPLREVLEEDIEKKIVNESKRVKGLRADSVLSTSTLRALAQYADSIQLKEEGFVETAREYSRAAGGGYLKADSFLNIDQLRALSDFAQKLGFRG